MELVYIILITFFGMIGAWLFGKWQDPYWRTKTYRKWMKKNYWLVYLVSRDNSRITPYVVNIDQSAIRFNNNLFLVENGSIYNEEKPEISLDIKKLKNKYIKWREETVPTIYVSEDSMVPLEFDKWERKVNPKEMDSALGSYHINMSNRYLMNKKEQLIIWCLLIGVICLLGIGYIAYQFYNFQNEIATGNIIVQKTINNMTTNSTNVNGDKVVINV